MKTCAQQEDAIFRNLLAQQVERARKAGMTDKWLNVK
jgi:hypothetical protein